MKLLGPMLVALLVLLLAPPAQAQVFSGCWNQGAGIDFGTVMLDTPPAVTGSIILGCQSGNSAGTLKYCVFLPGGAPIPGIAPRRMTNYNGAQMLYDLYSDAGRTQVIGPPPTGGGYPVYTGSVSVPGGYAGLTAPIPVYGSIPAGQNLPATFDFESQLSNGIVNWAFSPGAAPPSCTSGAVTGSVNVYFNVKAKVDNNCRIGVATDMDFGSSPDLAAALPGSSTISVRCPIGTPWTAALDNGANAAGNVRRMRVSSGQLLVYGLYQDAGLSRRWGSAGAELVSGTGAGVSIPTSLTVYGQVPPQPIVRAGNYLDTVTVTLTY